jgi:hypothetical protein
MARPQRVIASRDSVRIQADNEKELEEALDYYAGRGFQAVSVERLASGEHIATLHREGA